MKAEARLWECSLNTPLERRCYHHSAVWELHFPCFLLIRAEGVSLMEEQRQSYWRGCEQMKCVSGGSLSDSTAVCLSDYLKVSLLQGAGGISLPCTDSQIIQLECDKLSLCRYWSLESDRTRSVLLFHARTDFQQSISPPQCFKFHCRRCLIVPNLHSFASLSFPNSSPPSVGSSSFSNSSIIKHQKLKAPHSGRWGCCYWPFPHTTWIAAARMC